jgi:catalase-peroxidase
MGGEQTAGAGHGAEDARGNSEGVQRRAEGRQEGVAGRSDRHRRRRAIEQAAKKAGVDVQLPFTAGRTDATQEQTDVESFAVLEPDADGFRNFIGEGHHVPAEHLLIERAFRLTLSAPEMTVARRAACACWARTLVSRTAGVFTKSPGTLTNDFS